MTTDPTAEAVKAACLTAYRDCKYPACECDLIKQVQNACAAFTAAQLAGAGEQEITARHSLVEENGRNHIGEAHLHVAHKDRGMLLSTISALRAENNRLVKIVKLYEILLYTAGTMRGPQHD